MIVSIRVAHRFVLASENGLTVEPCEIEECSVSERGWATCGSLACPACGRGGSNLSDTQVVPESADSRILCSCGHSWSAR